MKVTAKAKLGTIQEVLVVPSLSKTLISVSQHDLLGYYTLYGERQVKLFDRNPTLYPKSAKILGTGRLENDGLYYFDHSSPFLQYHALAVTRSGSNKKPENVPNINEM
jgi:hypothetical protein